MTDALPLRPFGATGLRVPALGYGAIEIGDPALGDREAEALLRGALACGVVLVDTARSYGRSEERIGQLVRQLGADRDQLVLSTKVGYGVDGVPDWTGACVRGGIDRALGVLGVERIELVHLHSCPVDVLERGEVIAALIDARRAGKIACAAYSGDNEALVWAEACGQFDALQLSFSLFDQRARPVIERAAARGLGVLAKRPLGNAPWRFAARPVGHDAELSWERWQALGADVEALGAPAGMPWDELALRYAAHHAGVSAAIAGTRRLAHLQHNAALVARGPLPAPVVDAVRARYLSVGAGWSSKI